MSDESAYRKWGREPDGSFSADRLAYQIWLVGRDWAEKEAAADMLEATRKPLLAKLTNDYRKNGQESRRAAQDLAEGSDEYLEHVTKAILAKRDATIAKVKLESVRVFAEMFRTEESTRRQEMAFANRR